MSRTNNDAWYEFDNEAPGEFYDYDEDEMVKGDYVLVGSVPLSSWDIMMFRVEGVDCVIDLEMEYLR